MHGKIAIATAEWTRKIKFLSSVWQIYHNLTSNRVNAGVKVRHWPEQKYTTRILRRVVPRPCSAVCPQEADVAVRGLGASRV